MVLAAVYEQLRLQKQGGYFQIEYEQLSGKTKPSLTERLEAELHKHLVNPTPIPISCCITDLWTASAEHARTAMGKFSAYKQISITVAVASGCHLPYE